MKLRRSALVIAAAWLLGSALAQTGTQGHWIEIKGGAWPVDAATLSDMRERIQSATEAARSARPTIRMDGYTVQYQGTVQGKTRVVHLMGACKVRGASAEHLAERWLRVHDGGACYFEAIYDAGTATFRLFDFNGEA